jgi:RHH-type rel operon transcriptional repressor/antitoxin RelB
MTKPVEVRIQDKTFKRLKHLSEKTGRTTTFYIHEAIEKHIDELEDIYLAEQSLENLRKGKDKVMAKEDFWNELEN